MLKSSNRELKTTHNTFRDFRVRFFPTTFLETAVCILPDSALHVKLLLQKLNILMTCHEYFAIFRYQSSHVVHTATLTFLGVFHII